MDKRSWPWKRKSSSDKVMAAEKAVAAEKAPDALNSSLTASDLAKFQGYQENHRKPTHVQIPVEQYTHLTGLEEQVKSYEEQVQTMEEHIKELDEQLTSAHAEITAKDDLAKQHAKVAEEAVSGWEKAESEVLALKNHLESATLSKLTTENRVAHLDGALKECMRQIRNLKEEHQQKLQEVVITKSKQCERIKQELETRIGNLDQELLRSTAENAALSRSLQEQSNMLIQIREEKTRAEAEIEILKSNIDSYDREINSLKYELRVVNKELDIRNEEKNMSVRSAEAANKQHMEGVKKIAKLEAECQRLRGLVCKKLPGPAAVAQMKLEVESSGREYGESRLKRSTVKPTSHHLSGMLNNLDSVQKFHRETKFLTDPLLAMEEETKKLKEALEKRNSELQASRNMCAMITNKLQMLEAQSQLSSHGKCSPTSVVQIPGEGSLSHNANISPSLTSMSEDGNDDARSCSESWGTWSSNLSHIKKDKRSRQLNKDDSVNDLELMDDFLEMEKLACSAADSKGIISIVDHSENKMHELISSEDKKIPNNQESSDMEPSTVNYQGPLPLMKLRSRISMIFESMPKENEMRKILDDIAQAVQDASNELPEGYKSNENGHHCNMSNSSKGVDRGAEDANTTKDIHQPLEAFQKMTKDFITTLSHIHDSVLFLGEETAAIHTMSPNLDALTRGIEEFSVSYHRVLRGSMGLFDFLQELSHVLSIASQLKLNILGCSHAELEIDSPDCIEKVVLPQNKAAPQDSSMESYRSSSINISDSTSNHELPDYCNLGSCIVKHDVTCKAQLEDYEQLKSEKESMEQNLARTMENLEMTRCQLQETEQQLADVKSQLAEAKKLNSLSETQLKCMAESYRSLEKRAQYLETQVNLLRAKTESLSKELEDERTSHRDSLTRCNILQEQLTRLPSMAETDHDLQNGQVQEIAAAAEKLAECQETILLLGRQLKALRGEGDGISLQ
ncbi:hypothetical protein SAY86_029322 [Trapa natans]|uniref:Filament-like plant protein 4 n=1 Tax=Trapa natans TaxID=22666 RepID=A0AAN7RFW7_TRANT|nr:hypothetical protein SAY86_029322 [Trapa natans]